VTNGRGEEQPLEGGRLTAGVVRVGDTVRRPLGPRAEFVHQLLRHLEAVGFDGAPRVLGIDEQGREILSFLDGSLPNDLRPDWSDQDLTAAASLIRRYHDATVTSPLRQDQEVVCHNDLSPCNTVFRRRVPAALVDWDLAAPGPRAWDVVYAAWLWLDLGTDEVSAGRQGRRLRRFCLSYGLPPAPDLVTEIERRQRHNIRRALARGDHDAAAWASRCLAWTEEEHDVLVTELVD
jgi:hypothetical protein